MLNTISDSNVVDNLQAKAKRDLIDKILEESSHYLKGSQLLELNKTLNKHFEEYEIFVLQDTNLHENYIEENKSILDTYISNKQLEGLSPRTISYYEDTLIQFLQYVDKPLSDITTEDIREYLSYRQSINNCSNSTVDNIRRNLNTFFNTISNEGYIQYNPMAKVKKIKSAKKVKKPFTDFEIEAMRDVLNNASDRTKIQQYEKIRNLALFELLLSSGIRLNECVQLNKESINLKERTFIVLGKGNKERVCYFSPKCQYYLDKLLNFNYSGRTRKCEECEALFVTTKMGVRLGLNGIERLIRELGHKCGVKAHPHKFRRTFASNLVNKGVPIEQIKELMGHANMDTTLIYAIVDQDQIRYNHSKYAG